MARKSLMFGSAIKTVSAWDLDSDVGWTSLTGDESVKGVDLYFRYVPWLFRAVKDRAANVGALPWAIVKGDDNEIANSAEWSDDKPNELDWLDNPRKLFSQIEQSLAMTSKAFIFLECNPSGYIKGAKYCAPSTITELYHKDTGEIIGYERTIRGKKMTCTPASADWDPKYPGRIVAIYDSDYQSEIGPAKSSAALAALCASGVLYSTDKFIEQFFSRGAIKASVLSVESGSQAEHERLQAWWDDVIAGVKNAWSAIVMRGKVNAPVVIGQGTEGLENDSLTTSKRQDIATALGIPESRLWSSAANYATRDADEKAYFRGTIIPEFDLIAEAFNGQVFTAVHKLDGYRIESQPETLDVFQAEESDRAGSLKSLTDAGVPLKLAMEILGYDLTEEQWNMLEAEEAKPEPVPPALAPFAGQNNQPTNEVVQEPVEIEEVEEPEPAKHITADMLKELEIWQRKSIKAFKAGTGADCDFAVVTLSDDMAAEIKGELQSAKSIDEIKDIFAMHTDQPDAVNPLLVLARELKLAREALAV